jgi:ADP-heptose:LPS heptosyltransferase
VHPGAQWASRRWPAERFAAVADEMADSGAQIVLTGTAAETALAANVAERMRHAPIELVGQTSLGALAALVARARLVVCNDTGISHIAAALGTRSVVVASGSDTARWAPADSDRHRVLAHYPPCRPCTHPRCPYGHECALGVDASTVASTALQQLATSVRDSVRAAP